MMQNSFSQYFRFEFPSGGTDVWIGEDLLSDLPKTGFFDRKHPSKAFIFCDERLAQEGLGLAQKLASSLSLQGWATQIFLCPAGEQIKDFKQIYPLYSLLMEAGADRHSTLFAVGGGSVGDAIGFLAGTFQRGISWVGVPTTLLAQVDSSLGGKAGINHERGKNLIGVFHQPSAVLCDVGVLEGLSERELISGLGEVFKYGLIFDREFFDFLARDWKKALRQDRAFLTEVISRCLQWKAQLVRQDERDLLGVREVLNFGHTIGHALEAETGFQLLRHGEAVLLGMRAALQLSVLRGHLQKALAEDLDGVLSQLSISFAARLADLDPQGLLRRIRTDKKSRDGQVRFVLLKKAGETVLDRDVQESQILKALESVL